MRPSAQDKTAVGRAGEEAAARYLEQQGYVVLERNYRLRSGEVDIIARDGDYLVFVEVKTRSGGRFGSPFEAVDQRKQRRIARTALAYLAERNREMPVRFDVAAVFPANGSFRVELLRNAFDCNP